MIKQYCSYDKVSVTEGISNITEIASKVPEECVDNPSKVGVPGSCNFLFYETSMTDMQIGIILLVISLVILCTALVLIVKILNSMLKGKKQDLHSFKNSHKCNKLLKEFGTLLFYEVLTC